MAEATTLNGAATKPRKRRAKPAVDWTPEKLTEACENLRHLQRQRAVILKSRNMQSNRLQAIVAGTMGYSSGMAEGDRKKKFQEAAVVIKAIGSGKNDGAGYEMTKVVRTTLIGIDAFNEHKDELERQMRGIAKTLPVAGWVQAPEQRGFGILNLAIVVGECGDLNVYTNLGKLWRRMGCAPWTFDAMDGNGSQTKMGATWRGGREGKLPKHEWEAFGYSPRRRSISYLIGEGIVKQNFLKPVKGGTVVATDTETDKGGDDDSPLDGDAEGMAPGPYRARYLYAKAAVYKTHPEWTGPDGKSSWTACAKCDGAGCSNCGGIGKTCKRAHLHGMLLATKLLYKRLWVVWCGKPAVCPTWGV